MKFKELIQDEIDYYIDKCHFTPDELDVFTARCNGDKVVKISLELGMCDRTVTRISNKIKDKMKKVIQ